MERGLIPPAAELHLEPSPVRHKMAPLHDPTTRERRAITAGQVNNDSLSRAGTGAAPSVPFHVMY